MPIKREEEIVLDKVLVSFVHDGECYQIATPYNHDRPSLPDNQRWPSAALEIQRSV